MSRRTWITDIIRFIDNPWYIHRKNENEKYDIYDPTDSEFERLLKEAGITKEDCTECWFAIRCGDAGSSNLDPFESHEAALKWIEENQDSFYFTKYTNAELVKRFPKIEIRAAWSDIEKAFGISENPAAILGRKGGKAGTGESKRRGDSEYYRKIAKKGAEARKRKKEQS